MIKAYIDASTKGNPGPSAGGILLVGENLHKQKSFPLPILTNHQAEFATFVVLLDDLISENKTDETIFVYTDSKILADTIQKNHTKNEAFKTYLTDIQQKLKLFSLLIVQWVPEQENKGADHLARQGLQKVLKSKNR
ncbi:ribonuclease HI family protein [Enterococcus sp. LJL98]